MNGQVGLLRNGITYAQTEDHPEFSRLICAAVVNSSFRNLLLADPRQAVNAGYCGESFHLHEEELCQLESIQAVTLSEFAAQLIQRPEPARVPVSIGTRF